MCYNMEEKKESTMITTARELFTFAPFQTRVLSRWSLPLNG